MAHPIFQIVKRIPRKWIEIHEFKVPPIDLHRPGPPDFGIVLPEPQQRTELGIWRPSSAMRRVSIDTHEISNQPRVRYEDLNTRRYPIFDRARERSQSNVDMAEGMGVGSIWGVSFIESSSVPSAADSISVSEKIGFVPINEAF